MKRTKLGWLEEINARAGARTKLERYTPRSHIACVASVSARVRREKLGRGQKKGMTGKGEGKEGPFFCSRSNFRAISRLETLATQARSHTATVTHRGFIFRFHFPRVKAMWSKFSNQRMETSLPPSSVRVHRDGGWLSKEGESTPYSFVYSKGIHTFLERKARKNTWPFMRLTEVKERARISEEQKKNSIIGERCTWRRGSGVKTRCKF